MPDSIEELARRWKAQPDAPGAIQLCEVLRNASPIAWGPLVDEVGKLASERHSENGKVLVAVARLYAAVERLSDAQGVLVSAGRVAPRDPAVFRLLGEVLLRRGDAERAEKVLVRAQQLGASDADTTMWMDRARLFKPIQAKAGARAVAIEVKNTAVHPVTPHPGMRPGAIPPARPLISSVDEDAFTVIRGARPMFDGDAEETREVNAPPPRRAGGADSRGGAVSQRGPAAGLSAATDVQRHRPPPELPPERPRERLRESPRESPREQPEDGPAPARDDFVRLPTGPRARAAAPAVARATPPPLAPPSRPAAGRPPMPSFSDEETATKITSPKDLPEEPPPPEPPPPARVAPAAQARPVVRAAAVPAGGPMMMPSSNEVLDSLANAGVFEPREASRGAIVWDRPTEKARRRTAIGLSVGMVVFVLGAVGVFHEIQRRRAIAHDEAEALLAKVEADLHASKASLLPAVEASIGHAFELDSRSPRAAADWLAERAVKGLLEGGASIAFEDAVTRALEVKVPEEKVAFARVASFLFQGDTGGAAGLMPKWDGPAAKEPLYQIMTGATLEHAGDPHGAERFQAAVALDPDLVLAEVLLARSTAIDGDPVKAAELAKQFKAKHPDRVEGSALVALAWGRDPARGEQAPPEVAETVAHASELPLPLLAAPYALSAIMAIDKRAIPDAKAAIDKGLAVADDPGIATWLGSIALDTRDEPLIRKAVLLAVTFSAVYAPARMLAGRIALLGGRLEEALKATEELDATSPDVAVVRAATAYERLDADGVGRALETVPVDTRKLPIFAALNVTPDVLLGNEAAAWPAADAPQKLLDMSREEAPWSDLVAMDVALDLGLTDVADKISADWKGTEDKPLKAVRLSRLARYENRLDDADKGSKTALEAGSVTPRVLLERVFVLVAKNRAGEVGPLLGRYPQVLGPASSWLSAYALASTGKLEEARGRTAQLDFPPPLSPVTFRVMAAVSLAAMKDKKRGEPAVRTLLAAGSSDPDLLAAAASLGIKVVPRPVPRKR